MTNALEEFKEHTLNKDIVCAIITQNQYSTKVAELNLQKGYFKKELDMFLKCLNFDYDSGYGFQYLFGTIWYSDGTWSTRGEYDGSEWWEHNKCPEIPEELIRD